MGTLVDDQRAWLVRTLGLTGSEGAAMSITDLMKLYVGRQAAGAPINAVERGFVRGASGNNGTRLQAVFDDMLANGGRVLKFPGAGSNSQDSNWSLAGGSPTIAQMPPVHAGGPMEPVTIAGDGYGNTQIFGNNISSQTPVISDHLQWRCNILQGGPNYQEGASNLDYPYRFFECGFTDSGIFFGANLRVYFTMCSFSGAGIGPLLSHLSGGGKLIWAYFDNCDIMTPYLITGPLGYTIKELVVTGGSVGGGANAWTALYDANATVETVRTRGVANLADTTIG